VKYLTLAPALAALLFAGCMAPSRPPAPAQITGNGPVITFSVGNRSWKVPIPATIRRTPPDDAVELVDYRNDNGSDYLLLSVEGSSHGRNPAGYFCGGGDETTLVWARFRDGKLMATKQRIIRSCANNIETFRRGWFGQEYRADLFELKDGRTYRSQVRYNLTHLGDGIQSATWLEE
jgi:hypothetical protein